MKRPTKMMAATIIATTTPFVLAQDELVRAAPAATEPVLVDGTVTSAPTGTVPIVTEMIVWLEEDVTDEISLVASEHGVVVLDTLVASKGIFLLGSSEELDKGDVKKLFDKDERVRYAELNYEGASADGNRFHAWPSGAHEIEDLDEIDQPVLDLTAVHEHVTGDGVVVAVLDTGVDLDHQALEGRLLPGWDFIDDDDEPDDVATGLDRDGDGLLDEAWGHGTHISGIVAQVAPDAKLVPYRVLDSEGTGRAYAVAVAIFDAVDRGADVINLSFGLDHRSRSKMLKDALKYAKKSDVVVVAAAGNDAGDEKRYPAAESDVISVGALDRRSAGLATFANHGDWVEVGAPGVGIVSTLPDGRHGTWSGSSMAAPFVAGQAALLIDHAPDEDAKHVLKAIRKSCRKPDRGPKMKHGPIDVWSSLIRLSPID